MSKSGMWGYDNETGPHTWSREFPAAAGSMQSPISIEADSAEFSSQLAASPLSFGHPPLKGCELQNTGVSFMLSAGDQHATVEGGPLSSQYRFQQLHMHWGANDFAGSEHALNGRLLPAELHLVHWDCSRFPSFQDAVSVKDGLCVLGVFVEVGEENKEMQKLFSKFSEINQPNSKVSMGKTGIDLSSLLPQDTEQYFTYEGSLTTPPCYESVRWIVFNNPITFSEKQFETLRSLSGRGSTSMRGSVCQLVNNYRHLIPLGSRKLLASWQY